MTIVVMAFFVNIGGIIFQKELTDREGGFDKSCPTNRRFHLLFSSIAWNEVQWKEIRMSCS
jgi:hypothetical protein